jgi:hypothetical protein
VGRIILIDALAVAALFSLWYFCFAHYNRRKGALALRWVEIACSGQGKMVEARWFGTSRLQAHLRFAAHWFENARVTARLIPRPIPSQWLLSVWRKQKETVTFEADLGYVPSFQLEVLRHRWFSHKQSSGATSKNWEISRPEPVVLATRTEWTHELTPVVNTLMTSRGHNLISVRFRPQSPHFAATIDMETLTDERTAAAFLTVLRELAAGASTPRQ